MTGLLLDTHVLLWLLSDSDRLGPGTRDRVAQQPVHVSAISLWEVELKRSLGKLRFEGDLAQAVADAGVRQVPLRWEHTSAYPDVVLPHRDPFDRMLIAQARAEGLDFATADRQILGAGLAGIVDAHV